MTKKTLDELSIAYAQAGFETEYSIDSLAQFLSRWDTEHLMGLKAVAEACTPKWISVEERLPEHDIECLCSCGGSLTLTAFWNERTKEWDVYNRATASWDQYNVTHWQPLPEPPKYL